MSSVMMEGLNVKITIEEGIDGFRATWERGGMVASRRTKDIDASLEWCKKIAKREGYLK